MQVDVWTLPKCARCTRVKSLFEKRGLTVVEHDLEALRRGEEPDADAMTQLVLHDGYAPLVRIAGRFLEPREIESLVLKRGCCG